MTNTPVQVDAIQIVEAKSLDPIHVFWMNVKPGEGYATVTCYGCAWTVYFGGMAGKTIQKFFAEVDADYLVIKMGNAPTLKGGKKQDAYLKRIIEAIQAAIKPSDGPGEHDAGSKI